MRPATALLRLGALAEVSRRGAASYGVSRRSVVRTALRLRRRNGFSLEGALVDGLLDPAMPDAERYAHIGVARRRAAQDRLNPVSLEPFTEQKLLFHEYVRASGLPVAEVYGTAAPGGVWERRTGSTRQGPEAFSALLASTPGEVVVKPSFGNRGTDVTVSCATATDGPACAARRPIRRASTSGSGRGIPRTSTSSSAGCATTRGSRRSPTARCSRRSG